jgi:hypothetical protein
MSLPLDTLIAELGADLRPVRRLPGPLVRAGQWLALVGAAAIVLACFARLGAVADRLASVPDLWVAVLGSTLTMGMAAVATFELSLPDRRAAWALLPLPGLALWIAATGLGCLRHWAIPDLNPASMRQTGDCFSFIVVLSIPLSALTIVMVRRACPLRPNLAAATGGLAVAAAAATLLNFFHPYDAGAMDLAVHLVAIGLVVLANRALGGQLLTAKMRRPRR